MNNDNQDKVISGINVKKLLENLLIDISSNEHFNIEYELNYSVGYPNYAENQFKMDALIIFKDSDNERWLVKTTNTIRSDRAKGNQFDAQNIKQIDPKVGKIFLVTPDHINPNEVKHRIAYSRQITTGQLFSMIDDALSLNALRSLIREKAVENISQGKRANILGRDTEDQIKRALMNPDNKILWNSSGASSAHHKSDTFDLFSKVLVAFGVQPQEKIIEVYATTDIPLLDGLGYPKTDVHCEVTTDKQLYEMNISVKQSTDKKVTIHEGYVQDLLSALCIEETSKLGKSLLQLQKYGGKKKLAEEDAHSTEVLEKELSKYNEELVAFFVFGIGSSQVGIQVANLLLYYNTLEVLTVDETVQHMLSFKGQFDTPFSWTYPSGKGGEKIQIKAPTNNLRLK